MAFKAVDFYSGIGMTTATEMLLLAKAGHLAVFAGGIVAFDAFFKTVFWGADASSYGIAALMEYVLHMISTHLVR